MAHLENELEDTQNKMSQLKEQTEKELDEAKIKTGKLEELEIKHCNVVEQLAELQDTNRELQEKLDQNQV